ncbi:Fimbrin-like protein, partial [Globisporangium splendens]
MLIIVSSLCKGRPSLLISPPLKLGSIHSRIRRDKHKREEEDEEEEEAESNTHPPALVNATEAAMSYQLPSAFLQKFTPKEIHELKRVFKEHDHDYAAAITLTDLPTVLQKLGENVTPNQTAVMLKQVSLERPTQINFHEFLELLYDFRNGAIALDPSALMGHASISPMSAPVAAPAPVVPTSAPAPAESTPFFAKKATWAPNPAPEPVDSTPKQPSPFAQKAQWPPAASAAAQPPPPPPQQKSKWPPAGSFPSAPAQEQKTATPSWARPAATPPKESTPSIGATTPQWPAAGSSAQWPTAGSSSQWPPKSPAKDSSAKPQWPPTSPAKEQSGKAQWPPAGASKPSASPVSKAPQWPPAGQSAASPTKPQWPPNQPAQASADASSPSPNDAKRAQWPPAAPSGPPPQPPQPAAGSRSPPRSPVQDTAALDAHTIGVLQRRASAAARYNANATIHEVKGSAGGLHSYSEEETSAFTEHINNCLCHDKDLSSFLPMNPVDGLFRSVGDGILLCKLINAAVPETIDVRAVNTKKKSKELNIYEKTENHNLSINAAKSIGCSVVNIGPTDLIEGKPILVLGLVWQIIKIQLTSTINLKNHPELMRLLLDGETLEEFMKLPPDQILLRWVNYHLSAAGHPKKVNNFSSDLQDATAYSVLLHHIAPQECDLCHETVPEERAAHVIRNARKLQVETFIKPRDITSGNPKLNMSFVAQLFNTCPALDLVEEELKQLEEILYDDVGDTREERVFRMWINSLAIDGVYINHLFSDMRDGINLLKVFEKIEKGIVSWQKVNLVAPNKFKQVENCNYCVVLGKQLKFSLVNIGGADIFEGAKKLILSIIWQSMRYQQLKLLSGLSKGQAEITDKDIIDWANAKVRQGGRTKSQIVAFRDLTLSDALYLLDLVHAVEPRAVNWDQVSQGKSDDDKASNAKYAISCAQKIGAAVFLTYEDIVEVKPKMMMTFVASLMSLDMHNNA